MDYQILKSNREIVKGFLKQRIDNMIKQGIPKEKVIDYYKDLLEEMKNEKLFDEVLK